MDKFLHTAHEARENGFNKLDRKIQGQEDSIQNMAEVICSQAAAIKQDNDTFKQWMDHFDEIEEELKVAQGQIASLLDRMCHCRDVDAPEQVPSPALFYESYHSPPTTSPRENEIPLAVVLANTVSCSLSPWYVYLATCPTSCPSCVHLPLLAFPSLLRSSLPLGPLSAIDPRCLDSTPSFCDLVFATSHPQGSILVPIPVSSPSRDVPQSLAINPLP
jgi:hypothetical protein